MDLVDPVVAVSAFGRIGPHQGVARVDDVERRQCLAGHAAVRVEHEQGIGETVGQQVGQNLYLKVEQSIGQQSQTNFIIEYELTKWLRFRTNIIQGSFTQPQIFQKMQTSGVDLLFFFSY